MLINRNLAWIATKIDTPKNTRPVTVVLDSLDGAHTAGAFFKEGKWYEMYTKQEITIRVKCWADFELPEEYMF